MERFRASGALHHQKCRVSAVAGAAMYLWFVALGHGHLTVEQRGLIGLGVGRLLAKRSRLERDDLEQFSF